MTMGASNGPEGNNDRATTGVAQHYPNQLTALANKLKLHRDESDIANDVYEYVDDLQLLAELAPSGLPPPRRNRTGS